MPDIFLFILAGLLLAAILILLLTPFVLDAMTTCCLLLYYKKRDKDLRKAAKQRMTMIYASEPLFKNLLLFKDLVPNGCNVHDRTGRKLTNVIACNPETGRGDHLYANAIHRLVG